MFDIRSEYFTTVDWNRFINEKLDLEITKKLVDKSDIPGFANKLDLNRKKATLATKAQLKAEQEKIKKLEAFDSSSSSIKSDFEDGGTQNYLVFQSMGRYIIKIVNTYCISEWKSKGSSDESVKSPTTSDKIYFP